MSITAKAAAILARQPRMDLITADLILRRDYGIRLTNDQLTHTRRVSEALREKNFEEELNQVVSLFREVCRPIIVR